MRYQFVANGARPTIATEPPFEALGLLLSSVCTPARLCDFGAFLDAAEKSPEENAYYAHDYAEVELEPGSQTAAVFIESPASDDFHRADVDRSCLIVIGRLWMAHLQQSDWYRQIKSRHQTEPKGPGAG